MTANLSHRPSRIETEMDWQLEGLCRQVDPELFFPEHGQQYKSGIAKRVCARCDVQEICLEYALKHGERYGVWGGKSERERRELRYGRAS